MKLKNLMHGTRGSLTRAVAWLMGGCLAAGAVSAQDENPSTPAGPDEDASAEPAEAEEAIEEEPLDLHNWVEFGVGGTFTTGSRAEFQRQRQLPEVFGGVTSFHYEKPFGEEGMFKADARGLGGNDDYRVRLELNDPSKGYVRAGYREFRTWYNGAGGWYPTGGVWYDLYDFEQRVDRGEAWVELGLTLPDLPVLELGYRHLFRDGTKDSTSWGATNVPGGALAGTGILPTWLGLDERRDIFTADLSHTLGPVKFGVGGVYEHGELDNTRNLQGYNGLASKGITTQRDRSEDDLFNAHAFAETRISERVLFTLGYAYTDLDTDVSGYRVFGTAYDPDLGQRLPSAATYGGLSGGMNQSRHTGNLNFMVTLGDHLYLVPSVRFDRQDTDGGSLYTSPADPLGAIYGANSDRGYTEVSPNLDLRYSGLKNWVLYARGNWLAGEGDLTETWDNLSSAANVVNRRTDDRHFWQKYSAGFNWYACSAVSLSGQYYHKIRDNDYDHPLDSSANAPGSLIRYPAFLRAQNFVTDDVNARISLRPRSNVRLVLRYDYQMTTLSTQADQLAEQDTSDLNSQIYSASVSWTPWSRLYLLGSVNYVLDAMETLAAESVAVTPDARNNYWTATGGAGLVLDRKTDLNVNYVYYRADNYEPGVAAATVPYNVGFEQQGVTVGLTRQLNQRTRLGLQYGFFTNTDETSGRHLDYDAHLVFGTLQYRF